METKASKNSGDTAVNTFSASQKSNYEYDTLMSSLKVSVSKHLLDENFTMVWGNAYYYQIIQYTKEEYESIFHNRPNLYYGYHAYESELQKVSDAVIAAVTENKPGYTLITRMPVKSGGHIWVRMTGTFTDEYVDGYRVSYTVITDINDLVQIQREQSITYNTIPGFIAQYLVKENGAIELLDANDQFREFFDLPEGRETSSAFQTNLEICHKHFKKLNKKINAGEKIRFLSDMKDREGKTAWLQVNGECVDWMENEPVYLLVYLDVTDLTELREMQKQLEDQADLLRHALAEAEQANRAKSDFLSRMSHDIRTPMNAIVGMTEIAKSHIADKEKVKDCLKKITVSSQHLLGLINDVLDMSKIESGKMALAESSMSLPDTMESIISIVQPMIKSRKQHFFIRIHNLEHEHFLCDSLRLRQCFINILSNATKFTPESGSISIDVEEAPSEQPETANLVFTFNDTGIGMQPEYLSHIFDAFTRERDGRVDKTEGSGLGMAIMKKIVDLMGGTVEVASTPGKGTTFTVRLPLKIDQESDVCKLPPMNILVVDDDPITCEYTAHTLKECGVSSKWVTNGAEAIDQIIEAHHNNDDFDAVILDWIMPEQDGLETVLKIRTQLKAKLPIIIVSAYDWTDIEDAAKTAGVNGFLTKPLFRSTLCRGIYNYALNKNQPDPENQEQSVLKLYDKHILLAEDNELNREIAIEFLADMGASVDFACDGEECIEKFSDSDLHYYDLILMDVQMPKMDGYTATKKIRKMNREDNGLPILAMTADAFAEDIAASKEAGMNGHLSKPLDIAAMKNEIYKFIG